VHSFIAVWEMLVGVGIATPPWWLVDYGDWSLCPDSWAIFSGSW